MARPLRIEFPGAVYHVTSRGDRREPIFVDDEDRHALLGIVAQGLSRFNAEALAYCLMGNHYHFVLHTREANLSLLMRHINGIYTQAFNRRHDKVGHLFQGRFKAILVDRDAYLLEVCRYVDLNPVRARLVRKPEAWAWSSYRAHVGQTPAPVWLDTQGLHGYLLGRAVRTTADSRRAAAQYAGLVASVPDASLWDSALRQQIYLGDETFVEQMQALAEPRNSTDSDIPKIQRLKSRTLAQWLQSCENREQALYNAHTQSAITMSAIARELGLSISRVSRLIARAEEAKGESSGGNLA
jgi:REP element-mobilizing transposase RayT